MVRLSNRVKRSHLTEREKQHTIGLVFLGILLFVSSGLAALFLNVHLNIGTGIVAGFLILGTWFVAFPWGYIGAMEDERSE